VPAKPQWLCDIPAILDELRVVDVSVGNNPNLLAHSPVEPRP
jgi:hypothetical protein